MAGTESPETQKCSPAEEPGAAAEVSVAEEPGTAAEVIVAEEPGAAVEVSVAEEPGAAAAVRVAEESAPAVEDSVTEVVSAAPEVSPAADSSSAAEAASVAETGPVAEAVGEGEGDVPLPDTAPASELEEAYFPPTAAVVAPGTILQLGETLLTVEETLPGPWQVAHDADGAKVLVQMHGAPIWQDLPAHRLMPHPLFASADGYILPWLEGQPVDWTRPVAETLPWLLALAQLIRFFQAQGYAVVDLDPDHILLVADGLKLRIPPRLHPIGQPLPSLYRDGRTAPELITGEVASSKEGVFLLGTFLYQSATGHPLPEGGFSQTMLTGIAKPGLPQLLAQALAPVGKRVSPQEFLEDLRQLAAPPMPILRVATATTVGLNPDRPVNEDSYGYNVHVVDAFCGRLGLLRACVADGMGGMEAGEFASRAAVEGFLDEPPSHPLDAPDAQADWAEELTWQANQAVISALAGGEGGCTFTGVVCLGARFAIGHVGDTRAYKVSQTGVTRITRDHSLVAAMVANGMMTAEQAAVSPDRNKVLRSLGSLRQPQPGYVDDLSVATGARTGELAPGEAIVVVSDGVWGEVGERELDQLVQITSNDPQRVAEGLVEAALQAGAADNATAVVIYRER